MIRQKSFVTDNPKLYLVATPIGNLADITYRAVETLKSVDVCFAEDTRVTKVLFDHYNIKTPLECYQEFNKEVKGLTILNYLRQGKNVAQVSDAGMPVISDPGYYVAKLAMEEGFDVVPIPGPNAGLTALISSGLWPTNFTFYGFLDSKTTKRKKELEAIKNHKETMIFYEAPHRIDDTLADMLEVLGDRDICLARELTKKFEEFIRGKISEVIPILPELKGEMVVIVDGAKEEISYDDVDPIKQIDDLILAGMLKNDAIKTVAKRLGVSKQDMYKKYLENK